MSKIIIFTNDLGGVSVCVPIGGVPIEQVQSDDIPSGAQSYIVERSALPENADDFFNAWEQTNGVVTVNFDKAKGLAKERLRAERAPLLSAQDVLFQRALENGADTAAIIAEKKRLRDITDLADACTTLAELRALHC